MYIIKYNQYYLSQKTIVDKQGQERQVGRVMLTHRLKAILFNTMLEAEQERMKYKQHNEIEVVNVFKDMLNKKVA